MSDDLDHDAADELWRKVDRSESGESGRSVPSRSPMSLPPMALGFRHAGNTAVSDPAPAPSDPGEHPTTVFGPQNAPAEADTATRSFVPVGDRQRPEELPEDYEPMDKPRTDMGYFDVLSERRSFTDRLRENPAMVAAVSVAVIALAGLGTYAVSNALGGPSPTPEPTNQTVASNPQDPAPGEGSPQTTDSAPSAPSTLPPADSSEAGWKSNPEKLFTWYGDGMSEIAAAYRPIVGTSDFRYFWKADNETSTDRVLVQIDQAVRAGEVGDLIVFAYGNNDDVTAVQMNELRRVAGDRALVLVGTGTSDPQALPWSSNLNGRYQKMAAERPDTFYVDWQSRVTSDPRLVERGFVLTEDGTREWVAEINSAILSAYR